MFPWNVIAATVELNKATLYLYFKKQGGSLRYHRAPRHRILEENTRSAW